MANWVMRRQDAAAQVSFGGLKDRHAVSVQTVTIDGGPRRGMRQGDLRLEYLGQAERPFTALDIEGNGFGVVLRDIPRGDEAKGDRVLEEVRPVLLDLLPICETQLNGHKNSDE